MWRRYLSKERPLTSLLGITLLGLSSIVAVGAGRVVLGAVMTAFFTPGRQR